MAPLAPDTDLAVIRDASMFQNQQARQVKNVSKTTDRAASRVKQQVAKVSNSEIYNIRRIAHLQEMQRSHLCRMFLQLRK